MMKANAAVEQGRGAELVRERIVCVHGPCAITIARNLDRDKGRATNFAPTAALSSSYILIWTAIGP